MDDRTVKPRPLPGSRQGQDHRVAYRLAKVLGLALAVVLLLLLLARLVARDDGGHDWAPGPEETSTRFLEVEVDQALTALDAAVGALPTDPQAARRSLSEARAPLLRLRHYYLPLVQARTGAHGALRWYHLGEPRRALEELQRVEEVLLEMSALGDPQLSRELDEPLERVVQARAAMTATRSDAPGLLEGLGSRINLLLVKGGLAIHGTQLEGR